MSTIAQCALRPQWSRRLCTCPQMSWSGARVLFHGVLVCVYLSTRVLVCMYLFTGVSVRVYLGGVSGLNVFLSLPSCLGGPVMCLSVCLRTYCCNHAANSVTLVNFKLDGVGRVDNRPSSNRPHQKLKIYLWHMTRDRGHMTCDMRHVTCDMWHVTHDIWQVGGGEPFLEMSAS